MSLMLASRLAVAEGGSKTEAERLFEEARALQARGDVKEACRRFEASEEAEPAVGTLLNLVECAERSGATATAWRRVEEAARLVAESPGDARASFIAQKSRELRTRLSRLVIREARGAPLPPGAVVRRDGTVLPRTEIGVEVPLDPGAHTIDASASGRAGWTTTVDLPPGPVVVLVEVPALSALPSPDTSPAFKEPPAAPSRGARITWAAVLAGAGVAAIGVGAGFALASRAVWNDVTTACPGARCPTAAVLATQTPRESEAARDGVVGTVALVGGVAAIAGAAVVFWALPSSPGSRVGFAPDPRGGGALSVAGEF